MRNTESSPSGSIVVGESTVYPKSILSNCIFHRRSDEELEEAAAQEFRYGTAS